MQTASSSQEEKISVKLVQIFKKKSVKNCKENPCKIFSPSF